MTLERIIYLAGPISNMPDGNKLVFEAAAKAVRNMGVIVRNPHEFCADIPKESEWSEYMRRCIRHLSECTDIVLLPKFGRSKGAMIEYELALTLGIKVHIGVHKLKDSLEDQLFVVANSTTNA